MEITQRTIKILNVKNLPRKKKKMLKKAMRIKWYEEPIDIKYLQL